MNRTPVRSSNVAEVGYEQESLILEVVFHDGSIYHYFDVPQTIFEQMIGSESVGRFLNEHIKGHYRYSRL